MIHGMPTTSDENQSIPRSFPAVISGCLLKSPLCIYPIGSGFGQSSRADDCSIGVLPTTCEHCSADCVPENGVKEEPGLEVAKVWFLGWLNSTSLSVVDTFAGDHHRPPRCTDKELRLGWRIADEVDGACQKALNPFTIEFVRSRQALALPRLIESLYQDRGSISLILILARFCLTRYPTPRDGIL
jgi:hypothetical protein